MNRIYCASCDCRATKQQQRSAGFFSLFSVFLFSFIDDAKLLFALLEDLQVPSEDGFLTTDNEYCREHKQLASIRIGYRHTVLQQVTVDQ